MAGRASARAWPTALIVGVALAGSLSGCGGPSATPPALDVELLEEPVARAFEAARQNLESNPRSDEAWGLMGLFFLAHDFRDQARDCFAEAARFNRTDPRWPYLLAASIEPAPADEVLEPLRRAADLPAADPVVHLKLGETLLEGGQAEAAAQAFRGVLASHPSDGRAHLGLGRALKTLGDEDGAIAALAKALPDARNDRRVHALLAELYHRKGDVAAAERHRAALEELPTHALWPDPYLEQMMQHEFGSTALLLRARGFLANGRSDWALATVRRFIQLYPDRPEGHFLAYRLLSAQRDAFGAEQALNTGVGLAPDSLQSYYYRGLDSARRGSNARAVEFFRQATQREPQFAAAWVALAESLRRQGQSREAIDALRSAIRYKPDLASAHRGLGLLLAQLGQVSEAVLALERADALEPLQGEARRVYDTLKPAGRRQ